MSRSILQKLKPYYVRKALRYLKHYGPGDFLKTPEAFLRGLLDSVLGQTFRDLELVIANASPDDEDMARILHSCAEKDSRLTVIDLPENESIAANTNAAIRHASGTFICFMDHDDLIAPDALYEASRYALSPDIDLIYTDEDKIRDDGRGGLEHFQPHFKPDFSPDLLRSNNYICHFLMVRKSLIDDAGGPDDRFEGAPIAREFPSVAKTDPLHAPSHAANNQRYGKYK